jgi:hypothetical protein
MPSESKHGSIAINANPETGFRLTGSIGLASAWRVNLTPD